MKDMLKFAAITCAVAAVPASAIADASTRDFVVNAVTELFIEGDVEAIDRYWAEDYIQHNPMFPSGRGVIKELFGNTPPGFKYEMGMVIADDDLVAIHARYTGFGPKPLVAVDIFRVEDGHIAEHWDILQEEVQETASGIPMFEPMQ